MFDAVVGDEVEVVSKRGGEHLGLAKLVAVGLPVQLDVVNEGLEDDEEDAGAVRIALEDSFEEVKEVAHPVFGGDLAVELAVERLDVLPLSLWDVVVLKAELDEVVADTAKGISEVEPGDVNSSFLGFCILDHLLEDLDVLHAAVDPLEEGLLVAGVDVAINIGKENM